MQCTYQQVDWYYSLIDCVQPVLSSPGKPVHFLSAIRTINCLIWCSGNDRKKLRGRISKKVKKKNPKCFEFKSFLNIACVSQFINVIFYPLGISNFFNGQEVATGLDPFLIFLRLFKIVNNIDHQPFFFLSVALSAHLQT